MVDNIDQRIQDGIHFSDAIKCLLIASSGLLICRINESLDTNEMEGILYVSLNSKLFGLISIFSDLQLTFCCAKYTLKLD